MPERIVWRSADGTQLDLTDEGAGFRPLSAGTTGLRSVTYEIASSKYAGIDGETVDAVRAEANRPTLGLLVQADTEAQFLARARGLVRAMRPIVGPGTLTVSQEDGSSRTLTCYCTGGLEGDESADTTLPGSWWRLVLRLYAPDPWWYGPAQSLSVGLGAPTPFFPIPPVQLSSSTVQGSFTVDLSDSDAPAYPLWTVTGPGSSLVLSNVTTGRLIQVNTTLLAGQSLVIDTRPGFQSVRLSDGTNLMSSVASDPALWPLVETVNRVSATMSGASSASRITGVYQPRFSGI